MKGIDKTEFFHICSGLGALLIGMSIGIYLYTHFHGTEAVLLILGVTVYNVGMFGIYLIRDEEGKRVTGQTYLTRLLIWIVFAVILLVVNWVS